MDVNELDAQEERCRKAREILRQKNNLQQAIERLTIKQDIVELRVGLGKPETNESMIQFVDHREVAQTVCWAREFPELGQEIEAAIVSLLELKKTGLENQLAEL